MRDLIEELTPYIKDSLDPKPDKLRRMRKRDLVRLAIVRIFELMAEQRSLGRRILDTFKKPPSASYQQPSTKQQSLHQPIAQQHFQDEQQLRKTFGDYIEGMHLFLDQQTEKHQSSDLVVLIRLHFSMFIYKLIDSVQHKEKRALIFPENIRYSLFYLCDKWSGRFSLMQHNHLIATQQTQQQQQIHLMQMQQQQQQNAGLLSLRFNNVSASTGGTAAGQFGTSSGTSITGTPGIY